MVRTTRQRRASPLVAPRMPANLARIDKRISRMRVFSLEGKLAAMLALVAAVAALLGTVLGNWLGAPWLGVGFALLLVGAAIPVVARALVAPLLSLVRALSGSVVSLRDGDFSTSLTQNRRDEFGDLVRAHNELGRVLRDERQNLFQRELLLDTMVQNTPVAMVLVDPSRRVVHANIPRASCSAMATSSKARISMRCWR